MPEARDRISRPVDIAAMFARRRSGVAGILVEDSESADLFRSPVRPPHQHLEQQATPGTAATAERTAVRTQQRTATRAVAVTPRIGIWRGRYNSENSYASGSVRRGRGRNSALPSWYPRTPLGDITAIVRAMERRRARLREGETPNPEERGSLDPSSSNHKAASVTPRSVFRSKPYPNSVGKVPKILLGITNQSTEDSECLTPQKKLLNSIDSVEKIVMEELQKLKRTPEAKKTEREKRVRTLMTMR